MVLPAFYRGETEAQKGRATCMNILADDCQNKEQEHWPSPNSLADPCIHPAVVKATLFPCTWTVSYGQKGKYRGQCKILYPRFSICQASTFFVFHHIIYSGDRLHACRHSVLRAPCICIPTRLQFHFAQAFLQAIFAAVVVAKHFN